MELESGHGHPKKTKTKRISICWAPSFRKGFPFDYCHSRQSFIQHPLPVLNKPIETCTFHLTSPPNKKRQTPWKVPSFKWSWLVANPPDSQLAHLFRRLSFGRNRRRCRRFPTCHFHTRTSKDGGKFPWLRGYGGWNVMSIYTFYWWHPIEMIGDDVVFQYDYTTTAAVLRMMCFILSFCCKSSGMRHLFCHWGDVCSYE